jgi:hypothetical protein
LYFLSNFFIAFRVLLGATVLDGFSKLAALALRLASRSVGGCGAARQGALFEREQ